MGTTHCKRGSQNRCPHRNHFLTALLIAAMVMILTLPAFAVEAPATTNAPDTEVSVSMPDLLENPADENGPFTDEAGNSEATPAPSSDPVSDYDELIAAIAHANENDVIEFDDTIYTPTGSVLGRVDCPITIRRATPDARFILGDSRGENIKVQNITFDGAGIPGMYSFVYSNTPTQIFENCNFINYISEFSSALETGTGSDTHISNCHFDNNTGRWGAHILFDGRKITIENCTFTGGFASDRGSVYIKAKEKSFLYGCTISGNTAGDLGGGIYIHEGEVSITKCKIYGNTANGVANDITKDYISRLSLAEDYAALVALYKSDGVIPNRWSVDSHYDNNRGTDSTRADMIFSMTFVDNEPSPPPSPASITLDKSELALYVGETDTLAATIHPEGTGSSVQWTSSDPSIASVTETGLITAHTTGTAVITATETVSGISASCHVNVQDVPATTYSIGINASPVEGGTVNGGGQYEEGTAVTVTAVPNEDFRFLAWTEADTQISTEASLTFTVTSDRTLTAIFEPISKPAPKPIYTINTSAAVGGTVSGAGKYEKGSSVTLTATTESGYRFIAWTENNEQISVDESFTFIADRDRTIAANFARTYTINISAAVGGTISTGAAEEGTVSGCGGYFLKGSSMTYTAIPDSGYLFAGWTENGEQVSVDESITIVVDRDRTLVANFKLIPKPTYTIQVNSTQGGVAEGGGQYEEGKLITVNATPDNDYLFLHWEEDGEQVSTSETFTFTADRDRTLVANFKPISKSIYTINTSATIGGTASGGGEYEHGSSVTLTAVPESEYLFTGWTENGEQVSADENFTFIAEQHRTLVANFTLIPKPIYAIHVSPTQGGIAEGGGNYEEGKLVTVNAVPDADYRFLRWEENGVQVSTEARYSFAVEADRTLVSVFEPIPQSGSDSTNEPSYTPGTPSASHGPKGDNVRPVTTSMASLKEIQIPTLAKEKAVLIAPDDSFWVGYKAGRDNGMKTVTRADFAHLVYSMMDNEGRKIYGATRSPFRDIEPGAWYGTAVGTMLNTGIMVGCGDGLFCPNRTLTWGELLTVFARFAGDKPPTEYYTGSHWAKNAVNKAFTLGWLEYSETFNPGKIVTTGEMTDLIQAVFRWSIE